MKNVFRKNTVLFVAAIVHGSLLFWLFSNTELGRQPGVGAASQAYLDRKQQCHSLEMISEECKVDYFATRLPSGELISNEDEEEDPMLEKMPSVDFKAYRRADISYMYQETPGSRVEKEPDFPGLAGKFVNMSPQRLDLMYDNGSGPPGSLIGHTGPYESTGTSTYPEHVFYFVNPKSYEVVCSIRVKKGTSIYYCDPFVKTDLSDPSAGVLSGPVSSLDELNEQERSLYDAAKFNREFAPLYREFTGSEWFGNFPTEKPRHKMWRADYFGQEHVVTSPETQFTSLPPDKYLYSRLSVDEMVRNASAPLPFQEYREPGMMNITIKAVSVAPRIFQIDNFLSEIEVDHIVELANRKRLHRSTTGSGSDTQVSDVRTSETTWIPRHYSPVMNSIMKRAADVLRIDEALFRYRNPGEHPEMPTRIPINEDLQIVHYGQGQQYTAHTDHGYPDARPNAPSRSINLCIYLNEGMVGGGTAFPRWRNAETSDAIKAVPKRGKAMLFYMKNPDGNLDDLSQHAGMPVIEGEKWFANLWTWDPFRE